MGILRNRLSPNYQGGFGPEGNIMINVHADGENNGDMDINEAFRFIRSLGYPKVISGTNSGYDVLDGYIFLSGPPYIGLNLYEGVHTLERENAALHSINAPICFGGPVDGNGEPLATLTAEPFGEVAIISFNNVRLVSFDGVNIEAAVFAEDTTRFVFGLYGQEFAFPPEAPFSPEKVKAESLVLNNGSSVKAADAYLGSVYANNGSQALLFTCSFFDSVSSFTGAAAANSLSCVSLFEPDFSDYGINGAPALPSIFGIFDARLGGVVAISGNVDMPPERTATGVVVNSRGSVVIDGDVDWNGRTVGATAATTLTADGSFYNVTGTETP
jgi:hypothetical protein